MTKALEREYSGARAKATLTLNNFGGLEILNIEHGIDDFVIIRDQEDKIHRILLRYDARRPYFNWGKIRYHIDEFVRCGN